MTTLLDPQAPSQVLALCSKSSTTSTIRTKRLERLPLWDELLIRMNNEPADHLAIVRENVGEPSQNQIQFDGKGIKQVDPDREDWMFKYKEFSDMDHFELAF